MSYQIKFHQCEDGKWAAHTVAFDPNSKQHQMLVGFGRRKETARRSLHTEVAIFAMEVLENAKKISRSEATEISEQDKEGTPCTGETSDAVLTAVPQV